LPARDRNIETHDSLTVCRELLGRRAMPAAARGSVCQATAATGEPSLPVETKSSQVRPELVPAVRRPCRGRLARLLAVLVTTVLSLLITSSAQAEEVFTSQAAAANATDSTWIPAPAQRAAVCIVDTGNDPNPDTSNVIARLSVDGEPGTDRSPDHHGTLMSMIAAAPYNGFGMVGAAPSINVVSVRASRDGVTFGGTDLVRAVQRCVAYRNTYNIKVISLSLGGAAVSGLDAGSMATVEDMVDGARHAGLNVVAAAGNHVGAVDWPAGYAPVVAVGAADAGGSRCPFAAFGPEVDLWSSGCPLDVALADGSPAWASGSSESTAFVAAVLTQLRQLGPGLTVDQAEQAVVANARAGGTGRILDVAASFVSAGLDDQLAAGRTAVSVLVTDSDDTALMPLAPLSPSSSVPASTEVAAAPGVVRPRLISHLKEVRLARPPKPSVRLAHARSGGLSISFRNRPVGAEASVRVYTQSLHLQFARLARSLRIMNDRLRTKVSGTICLVSITYRDPKRFKQASVVLNLHPRR
jgi:hypothetical protein